MRVYEGKSRKVLIVDCLQRKRVRSCIRYAQMEIPSYSPPCQLLTTDCIVASSRCYNIVEPVEVDVSSGNTHIEFDVDP